MKHLKVILLLAIGLQSSVSFAQSASEECLEGVKAFYEQTGNFKNGFSLEMKMTSEYKDKNIPAVTTNIKIAANALKSLIVMDQMTVYQDHEYCVSIVNSKKQIYLANSQLGKEEVRKQELMTLKKEMLEGCLIREFNIENGIQKIKVKLNRENRALSYFDYVTFYYNPTTQKVIKAVVLYNESYDMEKVTIEFSDVNQNYSDPIFTGSVMSKFLINGTLKPEWINEGYQLVDVR